MGRTTSDRTANPLSFGPCSRCHNEVLGHAVYMNGILLCGWCELDLVVAVNQKASQKEHKKWWITEKKDD